MSDFGVTELGFNRKRLDVIKAEIEADLKALFGANLNVEPESPDGQIVGIFSKALADLYEVAESAYNSVNVSAATGAALSRLVQLGGTTRKAASPSTATVELLGTAGTTIPAGSEIKSPSTDVSFTLDDAVTIGPGGSGTGTITAAVTGATAVSAGTITEIGTPVAGWDSVNNPANGTTGSDTETDAELRARYVATRGVAGSGTVDAIFAAVSNVTGVDELRVDENRGDSTIIESGLPPHSVRVIVTGGDDDEIANAIWQNKPAGIATDGNNFVFITDSQGNPQGISFSRPAPVIVQVEVAMSLVSDPEGDATTTTGIETEVKNAIVEWAENNISVGENVIATALYTPVNEVAARYDVFSLKVRLQGGTLESTAPIASDGIASISFGNINVLVV